MLENIIWAAFGGGLIGLAATGLLFAGGRIAGISGILGRLITPLGSDYAWRIAFLSGLVLVPAVVAATGLVATPAGPSASLPVVIGAGLLVGVGTRMGSGCTSGHGVCGLSRRSNRSLAAVATFMATAVAVVFVTRHLLGVQS